MAKHEAYTGLDQSRDALLGPSLARRRPSVGGRRVAPPTQHSCCGCKIVTCWKLLLLVGVVIITAVFMFIMDRPSFKSVQVQQHIVMMQPAILRHIHSPMRRRLPQCLVIGVRKAGTTALLSFLNMHPDIVTAPNEVHFFDRDANYNQGYNWYLQQMPLSNTSQLTMEKSPAYFVVEDVPRRIHDMNSSIKLLLIVREPVERAVSDYLQIHMKKISRNKTALPFELLAVDSNGTGNVNGDYPPVARSLYDEYMEGWLDLFNLSQIHLVNGDQLVDNPAEELAAIENFLGLSHHLGGGLFEFNATKGFHCAQISGQEHCLEGSKGRKHPDIDPSILEKLRQYYKPHNKRFFQMVKRTFLWP